MPRPFRLAALFTGLAVLMHPLFLVIYRMSLFNTVPRDDYAGYLLWLLGKPGGAFPDSPYCYRAGSMLLAAPFTLLPLIPLTNTPAGLPPEYLKATAALSALAFLATVACVPLGYALARQARLGRAEAIAAGALLGFLTLYTQFTAIDPLAVALVAGGVLLVRHPVAFGALLLLSVPINEKVALVLATWLIIRVLVSAADRRALLRPALLAVAAVALYGLGVAVLHFPGNAYQQELGSYPSTLAANVAAYLSARGLLLNVLPLGILLGLAVAGRPCGVFRRADLLLVPALAVIALVLTQYFQAGRIAMHAAPIFVAPAAAGLLARLRGTAPGR